MNSMRRWTIRLLMGCVVMTGAGTSTQIGLMRSTSAQPPDRVSEQPLLPLPITVEELNQLIGGPTLITLRFKDATPQAVFDELARQAKAAGTDLQLARPAGPDQVIDKPLVTIDIDRQPFWVALRALSPHFALYQMGRVDKSGLTLRARIGQEDADNGDTLLGPSAISGPCLIVAQRISRSQTVSLGLNRPQPTVKSESMNVAFMVFVDPKLRVSRHASRLQLEHVTDEKGNSLLRPQMRGQFENIGSFFGVSPTTPLSFSANLTLPPNPGKRIARFKATLRLAVDTRQEVWEVPNILEARDIAKTITTQRGDERYVIEEVKQRGQSYGVRAVISHPAPGDRGEGRINHNIFNSMRLLDAQGRELQRGGASSRGSTNELSGDITFSRPQGRDPVAVGEPVKLVWDIPTGSEAIEVPFEFTDLPLP